MSVRITGPLLSALLYEHSSADNDVEGLLCGTMTNIVTDSISDYSISNVEQKTVYSVFSFIPCSTNSRWYDSKMDVVEEALTQLMQTRNVQELIGWYRLRRRTSLSVSMKERSISKHLLKLLRTRTGDPKRNILFMLCVSYSSANTALYTCDHQFMLCNEREFTCIPESVINLAELPRTNYRLHYSQVTSSDCTYRRVLAKNRATFVDDAGESKAVSEMRYLNSELYSKLKSLCEAVKDSEQKIKEQLDEVFSLRSKVASSQVSCGGEEIPDLLTSDLTDVVPVERLNSSSSSSSENVNEPSMNIAANAKLDNSEPLIQFETEDGYGHEVQQCPRPSPVSGTGNSQAVEDLLTGDDDSTTDGQALTCDSIADTFSILPPSTTHQPSASLANGVEDNSGRLLAKPEPFGFVGEMMTSLNSNSPTKKLTEHDDKRNVTSKDALHSTSHQTRRGPVDRRYDNANISNETF